jgi:membrane AbrB-like protein
MQHFIRIIIVVVAIPFLFFIVTGEAVGSASGQTMAQSIAHWYDIPVLLIFGALGLGFARIIHLPAGHLMGPLLVSAVAHAVGLVDLSSPAWLLALCQLIIGVSLGLRFAGMRAKMLAKAMGLSLVTVGYMLILAVIFAAGLAQIVPTTFAALFISFAPGGVIEMGLIALSLSLSPVIVAGLHLLRIVMAVSFLVFLSRRLGLS